MRTILLMSGLRRLRQGLLGMLLAAIGLGCTPIQVWMGWRVRLEKTPISALSASLPAGGLAPGEKAALVVTVVQPDGAALHTEGSPGGKVLWEDLQISATVAGASPKGQVSIPADPRLSDGRIPHLTITVPSHPELRTELDVPVRYDRGFHADFSGRPGSSGSDGMAGSDGMSGSSGSIDLNNPSPGGSGSAGSSGSDGQDGGPGGDAPTLVVNVAFRAGTHPLLQVSVRGGDRVDRFLVDPRGGYLTVNADGGAGGSGGHGGPGGRGGSGGSGSPSGSNGSDGSSGRDGWSGSPGRGGSITVLYDPSAAPYLGILRLSSQDGNGRPSGRVPVFLEAPMQPLW